ncbi:MAG TPA: prepilin-type N-terminal cleavage/methylation domain-containing protein [Phycisphaerae bacterium]|nr:prepilin-type N-terminal cleavage/methylation domain-containing protein [Phycisphaerae bacterium]
MHRGISRRRAFTLIELLVVVAILALLLAMLSPLMNRARQMARRAVCQSNFRTMGVAASGFAAAHNGRGPGCSGQWLPHSSGGYYYSGPGWYGILNAEYFRAAKIPMACYFHPAYVWRNKGKLVCPSIVQHGRSWTYWMVYNHDAHGGEHGRPITAGNSSFYGKIVPAPPEYASYGPDLDYMLGARLYLFPQPAWQMLIAEGECGWDLLRPSHAVEVYPIGLDPSRPDYCGQDGHHAFRHFMTSTFTFIDGHVECLAPGDQLTSRDRYAYR